MNKRIRLAIAGYGNISRGCIAAIKDNPDTELAAVFTRRSPEDIKLKENAVVDRLDNIAAYKDKIDVLLLCLGSATDLPEWGPRLARDFCTVDSYDNHSQMSGYLAKMDAAARGGGKIAVAGTGWDPGLFSLARLNMEAVLPAGKNYTFWGKGVSQGHSDAIRRVKGVKKGIQYTVPEESTLAAVRAGNAGDFTKRQMHLRECFVVAEQGADLAYIEQAIKTMPDYFEPYNTSVTFIEEKTFDAEHGKMPHGGFVIRAGKTAGSNSAVTEFSLKLGSNPEFTAGVMVAYARAAKRLHDQGGCGVYTVFDIPPALLSPKSREEIIKEML